MIIPFPTEALSISFQKYKRSREFLFNIHKASISGNIALLNMSCKKHILKLLGSDGFNILINNLLKTNG